jgi:hypothetical protein
MLDAAARSVIWLYAALLCDRTIGSQASCPKKGRQRKKDALSLQSGGIRRPRTLPFHGKELSLQALRLGKNVEN